MLSGTPSAQAAFSPTYGFVFPSSVFKKPSTISLRSHHAKTKIHPLIVAMTLNAASNKKDSAPQEQDTNAATVIEDPYNRAMAAWPGELDATWEGRMKGRIPQELLGGTFWINGPAPSSHTGRSTHPFDCHGYLRALRIMGDGRIRLQAKMLKSPLFLKEQKAGEMLATGLATLPHTNWLRNLLAPMGRNAGNTCVMPWAGKLLALYEGGLPHALNPDTLDTLGTENFGGALSPSDFFLAHTRWDAKANRLLGVTPRHGGRSDTEYILREIDEDGRQYSSLSTKLDCFTYTHDVAITKNYWVVMDCSVDISVPSFFKAMTRTGVLIESLQFVQRPARLVLMPRKGGDARVITLDRPMMVIHHANAWEEEDGTVVLISCALPGFSFGKEFGWQGPWQPLNPAPEGWPPQVMRIEITKDGQSTTRVLSDTPMDFPKVRPERDGLPTKHIWGALTRDSKRATLLCGLAHIDIDAAAKGGPGGAGVESWLAPPGCMVGEPLVVPKSTSIRGTVKKTAAQTPREEDVWVLAMLYDGAGGSTTMAVFDGGNVAAGPVCEVEMPLLMPYGFHGFWQPAATPTSVPPQALPVKNVVSAGKGVGGFMPAGAATAAAAAAAATASAVAMVAMFLQV